MASVEVRIEGSAADDGALRDKVCDANPTGGVGYADVGTGIAGLQTSVRRIGVYAGEEHTLALRYHPLVFVLLHQGQFIALADGQLVNASLIPVAGGEQGNAGSGVTGFVIQTRDVSGTAMVAAELVLVAFQTVEDFLERIYANGLCVRNLGINVEVRAVVHKHGVVNLAIGIVLQPCGLGTVEGAVGVIPLGPQTLGGQISHKGLEFLIAAFFLVQEVAVIAEIFRHGDELIGHRESAFAVLLNHIHAGLAGTESRIKVDTGNGQNAVLMRRVGVSGVWNIYDTELKASGAPVAGDRIIQRLGSIGCRCAVPGGIIVCILPEIQHMFAEFVGIQRAAEKAVAVVALHQHDLGIGLQIRFCLGCLKCLVAVLQGNLRAQKLCIRVGFRIPILYVLDAITGKRRFC